MITINAHDTFHFQIPDYMETHYKEENEDLSQYFVARYHSDDPDWEHFGGAEIGIGLTRQFKGGFEGVDYSDPQVQEIVLKKMNLVQMQSQMFLMKATGGLLKSFIFDPADGYPSIHHAEKQMIIIILERANDYSKTQIHLEINDGTSYEISFNDNRDVDSDQKKQLVCTFMDSIKLGTSANSETSATGEKIQKKKTSGSSKNKAQFEIDGSTLVSYKGKEAVITIPDGITEIKAKAFYKKDFITEVSLPDSLNKIGDWAFGLL